MAIDYEIWIDRDESYNIQCTTGALPMHVRMRLFKLEDEEEARKSISYPFKMGIHLRRNRESIVVRALCMTLMRSANAAAKDCISLVVATVENDQDFVLKTLKL